MYMCVGVEELKKLVLALIFTLLIIFSRNRIAGFHNKTGAHSPLSPPLPEFNRSGLKLVCNVNIGSAPTREKAWVY
jgi:hypothetical protein